MTIHETTQDGISIIAPQGRIDTTTSGDVDEALRRTVDGGARSVLVDFAAVDYISSAGLRVFLVVAKRMKDLGGRLVAAGRGSASPHAGQRGEPHRDATHGRHVDHVL